MTASDTALAAEREVDVIVVGMGPGGEAVAGELAAAGLSVVGIERGLVGGECPYYGCVPSKMMIRAANALAEAGRVNQLAGTSQVTPDFGVVARRISDEATDNWDDAVAAKRFTDKGGILVRGTARMTGPRHVTVARHHSEGEVSYSAKLAVVLNPGTDPAVPTVEGLEGTPFWTNREAVKAKEAPASLTVVGGGPIAVELAQMFARFGSKVTILVRGELLIPQDEPEAAQLLGQLLVEEGIELRFETEVVAVAHSEAGFSLGLSDGNVLDSEKLLYATGRKSGLQRLNLQAAGITWDGKNPPQTDGHLQLGGGVYLVGDAVGAGAFTHMSMYHANIVAGRILASAHGGRDRGVVENNAIPHVTFTDPEIASVGMSESQARKAGLDVDTAITELPASSRGWIHNLGNQGFIKLVRDRSTDTLVGATSVGPMGGEVLSMLTLAVHAGTPVDTLRTMIYTYPTFHRAIPDALAQLPQLS